MRKDHEVQKMDKVRLYMNSESSFQTENSKAGERNKP